MKKQTYRPYEQNQLMLLPLNLKELIPVGHLVRVVDDIIEQIDIDL